MATIRGTAKKNIMRAVNNARRIPERLVYLKQQYPDFPEFMEAVDLGVGVAASLEEHLLRLLDKLP